MFKNLKLIYSHTRDARASVYFHHTVYEIPIDLEKPKEIIKTVIKNDKLYIITSTALPFLPFQSSREMMQELQEREEIQSLY